MAYDEAHADRMRAALASSPDVLDGALTEKKMFGGLGFMIDGHMVAAATNGGCMMLRVDPALTDTYVDGLHVQRFEMRGRGLRGWLDLAPEAVADDEDLRDWLAIGIAHVRSLPPKD